MMNGLGNEFNQQRSGTGTKEWAEHNINIGRGCSHDCLYCYAREMALRFKQIEVPSEWYLEHINNKAVDAKRDKKDGLIMFPTTHDITPYYLESSIIVLRKLLTAGNKVLIVSKPHPTCIIKLCNEFGDFKDSILFRFTIGSLSPVLCKDWEPGAPKPFERYEALLHAYRDGFATSVSMEPFLGTVDQTIRDFRVIESYITDKIWIGKMNKISRRVKIYKPKIAEMVKQIRSNQADEAILYLYEQLKNHPKAAWKESIKEVVGHA